MINVNLREGCSARSTSNTRTTTDDHLINKTSTNNLYVFELRDDRALDYQPIAALPGTVRCPTVSGIIASELYNALIKDHCGTIDIFILSSSPAITQKMGFKRAVEVRNTTAVPLITDEQYAVVHCI
jgi:hypothetical protein